MAVDGEVIEADPPRKLVLTWRMVMDPELAAEGFTRLTYETRRRPRRRHEAHGGPRPRRRAKAGGAASRRAGAEGAGRGWSWVLSDLKTLLETGKLRPAAGQRL